jgi:hypothetical protein
LYSGKIYFNSGCETFANVCEIKVVMVDTYEEGRKEGTRGHRLLHLTLMPFLHIKCSSYCLCPKDVMLGKAEGEVGYTHNNKC